MKTKTNTIQAKRLMALRRTLRVEKLDIILVCSSLQEFGYGFALNSIKPIIYHYFFIKKGALEHGFFLPQYLTERLGLGKTANVIGFGDSEVSESMAKLLRNAKRVGVLGPAPAEHFSESQAELVFLDDKLWTILVKKTAREIGKIREVSSVLARALKKAGEMIVPGGRQELIAEAIDKQILKEADDVAFPSLVESRRGKKHILSFLGIKSRLRKKDLVYINVGAQKDGLFADAGRMFFLDNPGMKRNYAKLEKAFEAFVKDLRPGLKLCELPGLLKMRMKAVGLARANLNTDYFGHNVGFSIIGLPYIGEKLFPDAVLETESTWSFFIRVELNGEDLGLQHTVLVKARGGEILTK